MGWWHWVQNVWLLHTGDHLDVTLIRDKLGEHYGDANTLVLDIGDTPVAWAGYGPTEGERSMFAWLRASWPLGSRK